MSYPDSDGSTVRPDTPQIVSKTSPRRGGIEGTRANASGRLPIVVRALFNQKSRATPTNANSSIGFDPRHAKSIFAVAVELRRLEVSAVQNEGRNIGRHLLRPLPVRAVARFLIDPEPRGR